MEYKHDEQPLLNGRGTAQPESLQHAAVPATLLPAILSNLGLEDSSMTGENQIVAALRDGKSHVKVAAIRSLGERREVSALQFLVYAMHDPAWEVRVAAVWALSAFGGQAPVEPLKEALADEDGSVRAAALRVLSEMRGQVPPEQLSGMLNDADWLVREAAALTVEELGEFEILGDRYQIQEPIGRGGMATIYRSRDVDMDRIVAIKILREVYNTDAKFVARFQLEAKTASALQHPNIVQVYDYGQTMGNYYIVMELVEGINLRRYLRGRGGVLNVDRAVIIAHDVALALGAAHRRNIVHRDVKPQNILVGRNGSIKLTDFGIASVYTDNNASRLTTTGMTVGTVLYYAPEQARGEIVSPAADVYALGIVMYEMLTGRTPFEGDSPLTVALQHIQDAPIPPSQFNSSIPAALEEIILRCLEKAPETRFRDGSQLARALVMLGETTLGETGHVPSGRTPIPTTSHPIPSHPGNSGPSSTGQNNPPDAPASFPEHGTGPDAPSDQNDSSHFSDPHMNQPVPPDQRPFAPPPGSVASYRFQRRTVPRSGVVQPDQRNSRFASIITILIPLAILLLLGFSIYLAAGIGFVRFPFINSPTPPPAIGTVPNLRGLDYQAAFVRARHVGFNLRSQDSKTIGVVINQFPYAGNTAVKNSTITVEMGPSTSSPTPTPMPDPSPTPSPTPGPNPTPTPTALIPRDWWLLRS
jgi:serine/threonine-protein kinase